MNFSENVLISSLFELIVDLYMSKFSEKDSDKFGIQTFAALLAKISPLIHINEPKYMFHGETFTTSIVNFLPWLINEGYFSSVFEVFEHGHFEYWE